MPSPGAPSPAATIAKVKRVLKLAVVALSWSATGWPYDIRPAQLLISFPSLLQVRSTRLPCGGDAEPSNSRSSLPAR